MLGDAPFYGSTGHLHLARPIVGVAGTAPGLGYYEVSPTAACSPMATRGSSARLESIHLNKPIVGLAVTPSGHGYWFVAIDGGIFSFGDAPPSSARLVRVT